MLAVGDYHRACPSSAGNVDNSACVSCVLYKSFYGSAVGADKRNNSYWIRKVAVVALTDATKVVKITIGG